MLTRSLFVRLEAKPGKEKEVAALLIQGLELANREETTPVWFATQLGPTWPEGVDVSFGQWQKLALSRGFMRDQPLLLVLDEPTAALDAETEHAIFDRYERWEEEQGEGDQCCAHCVRS